MLPETTDMQRRSCSMADLVVGSACGCTLEVAVTMATRHARNVVTLQRYEAQTSGLGKGLCETRTKEYNAKTWQDVS